MIQIRNVPDSVLRILKARVSLAGISLSDFLLAEICRVAKRPTIGERRERVRRRSPAIVALSAAEAVRSERDALWIRRDKSAPGRHANLEVVRCA